MRWTIIAVVLGLASCQAPGRYVWGQYNQSVYAITSGEGGDIGQYVDNLVEQIEIAKTSEKAIPPGMHAQLGLLYGQLGNLDLAVAALESERELYPESATFIDGVLQRMGHEQ